MSLCCCGNWRSNHKHSRSRNDKDNNNNTVLKSTDDDVRKTSNKSEDIVVEVLETSIIDPVSDVDRTVCLSKQSPRVIFRADTDHDIPLESIEMITDGDGRARLPGSHGNYLIKSVLHRSIKFQLEPNNNNNKLSDDSHEKIKKFDKSQTTLKPFMATSRRGSLYIFRNADDIIITPFAQILASLRKVRANFMLITNIASSSVNDRNTKQDKSEDIITPTVQTTNADTDNSTKSIASETLKELEWCLSRLENIQTHRSVSDMASTKFKEIINRELSQYAETSKSGHQISDYICKTFLDSPLDDNIQEASSAERELEETDESRRSELSKYGPKLAKANTEPTLKSRNISSDYIVANDSTVNRGDVAEEVHLLEDNLPLLGVNVPNEEEVIEIINQNLLKWGMDLFSFSKATADQSLVVISYAIFKHHNLINKFQIDSKILIQFLVRVESSYRSTVPYHNSMHAADVTQSANVLLNGPALDNVFSDLEILSVIFACIVHDMDHPGLTNQYLVNSNSELATLYNDSSVLENHHLAMAFTLLTNKDCDFLTALTRRQKQSMRRMVIDMVLATDMSKHMTLLADLKTMVETKKVAGSGILTLDTYTDRIQILQNLVHCSDLSNPTKPLLLYQIWTGRIMEEFFLQGDKERDNDLEISPMCDRQTATVEKSQVSFIDFIVHPLWETWSELVYPDSQEIMDTLEENRRWYYNMSQEKDISSHDYN